MIMRPRGEVAHLSISPLILVFSIIFALVFTGAAIVAMNLYYGLYLDFRDLEAAYQKAEAELTRLESLYRYQSSVTNDYADHLSGLGRYDQAPPAPDPDPAGAALPDQAPPAAADDPLTAWAAFFPDPPLPPAQLLGIEDFKAEEGRFSFHLTNQLAGSQAKGHILALFLVESGGRRLLAPYPDFDVQSRDPDFETGPGYFIRSSKPVAGQLAVPAGSRIVAMMVVARAQEGQIVMKKRLAP
jgi:hypothetical protein